MYNVDTRVNMTMTKEEFYDIIGLSAPKTMFQCVVRLNQQTSNTSVTQTISSDVIFSTRNVDAFLRSGVSMIVICAFMLAAFGICIFALLRRRYAKPDIRKLLGKNPIGMMKPGHPDSNCPDPVSTKTRQDQSSRAKPDGAHSLIERIHGSSMCSGSK